MERTLASAQVVSAIRPIDGADAIELAQVEGWQVVVKKGEFQPGDVGVFLEIDSVPPDTEPFRFLWKNAEPRPANYRLRTCKLRGALSQGLLLTPKSLGIDAKPGDDLTEALGVVKWERPEVGPYGFASGLSGGLWPTFLPKTDETRIQNVLACIDELRGLPYVATLKCDGTSATYAIAPDGEFLVCSRNQTKPKDADVYWKMAAKYGIEAKLRPSSHVAIQAEIVGPGIQKNKLGLKEHELRVFDCLQHGRPAGHDATEAWTKHWGLPMVDIVERGDDFQHSKESLLALAEGKYPGTTNEREGIVVRPLVERYSPRLKGRLSFKVISNRFLLKESD